MRLAELCAALSLAAALYLGGASQIDAVPLGLAEALALPTLGLGVWRLRRAWDPRRHAAPLLIVGALALIPLLQLIPLPPEVWTRLPGRADALASLSAAGLAPAAHGLSLTPEATLECLLALLPPAALLIMTLTLEDAARLRLVAIVVAVALVSVLLGVFQETRVLNDHLEFYASSTPGSPGGVFANRNHQALFLACAIPFSAALLAAVQVRRDRIGRARAAFVAVAPALGVMAILFLGVAITGSRAGLLLVVPAIGLTAVLWRGGRGSRRGAALIGLAAVGVIAVAALAALGAGRLLALPRFDHGAADMRFEAAPRVIAAARAYWPWGSGVGSFVPVYQTFEPTRLVDTTFFNHAHDDYLEATLEAGVFAWIVFAGFVAWFLPRLVSLWRAPKSGRVPILARAASIAPILILLHSTVDYPLRTVAITTLFALACALMIPPREAAP